MNNYTDYLVMLSTEFHRYMMENEEFAESIPANAVVRFKVEAEEDFNEWHEETSLKNREAGQPIIYVYVKKWRKHSSIEELNVEAVA